LFGKRFLKYQRVSHFQLFRSQNSEKSRPHYMPSTRPCVPIVTRQAFGHNVSEAYIHKQIWPAAVFNVVVAIGRRQHKYANYLLRLLPSRHIEIDATSSRIDIFQHDNIKDMADVPTAAPCNMRSRGHVHGPFDRRSNQHRRRQYRCGWLEASISGRCERGATKPPLGIRSLWRIA
jgi:hypothetical protein